jgi:RsiW-degrading membrane proteinase PrsW (M82 family)
MESENNPSSQKYNCVRRLSSAFLMYQHANGVLSPRCKPRFYSKDETVETPKMLVLFSWLHGFRSQKGIVLLVVFMLDLVLRIELALYWEENFEDKMAGYLKWDSYGAFLPEELISWLKIVHDRFQQSSYGLTKRNVAKICLYTLNQIYCWKIPYIN